MSAYIEGLDEAIKIGERVLIQMKLTSRDVSPEIKEITILAHERLLRAAKAYAVLQDSR